MSTSSSQKKQWPKLKPEVKTAWLKALRSGEFKQGKGGLCREEFNEISGESTFQFCCLGVVCALGKKQNWKSSKAKGLIVPWMYGNADGYPPDNVAKEMFVEGSRLKTGGMRDTDQPSIQEVFDHLVVMNDGGMFGGRQYKFPTIAQWIEKNL